MTTLDHSPELTVSVHRGPRAVARVAPAIASLARSVGSPITSTWPWVSECVVEGVWALVVAAGDTVAAAAVLNDTVTEAGVVTTLSGTAGGHRGALHAGDPAAAEVLGAALAAALVDAPRSLSLGPLAASDALASLLRHLPAAVTVEPVEIPLLRPQGEPEAELTPSMRRNLRKARNRLATDGVTARVETTDDGAHIASLLPLVLTVARDRDRACGRVSPLDDLAARRQWRSRLLGLAETGRLHLATLLLDDEVAAYAIAVTEGSCVRVLDGRYVDRFARYAPGRLLEADLLERVRRSEVYDVLDWMTTVGPDSLLASNDADALVVVTGTT